MTLNGLHLGGCEWNLPAMNGAAQMTSPYLLEYTGTLPVEVSVWEPPKRISFYPGTTAGINTDGTLEFEYDYLPEANLDPLEIVPSNTSSSMCNIPRPPFRFAKTFHSDQVHTMNSTHVQRLFHIPEIPCVTAPMVFSRYISIRDLTVNSIEPSDMYELSSDSPPPAPVVVWVIVGIISALFLVGMSVTLYQLTCAKG
jgi:hypothetical protein